jgi:hypothetical protein
MNTIIQQLARQAQATTSDQEQIDLVILILQDAIRRLELLKEPK